MLEARTHLCHLGRRVILLVSMPFRTDSFEQVRYWLLGPEKGQKVRLHYVPVTALPRDLTRRTQVILIHGLSIPAIIWRDVAPTLAANGHRVLLYGERIVRPAMTRFSRAWQTSMAAATLTPPKQNTTRIYIPPNWHSSCNI